MDSSDEIHTGQRHFYEDELESANTASHPQFQDDGCDHHDTYNQQSDKQGEDISDSKNIGIRDIANPPESTQGTSVSQMKKKIAEAERQRSLAEEARKRIESELNSTRRLSRRKSERRPQQENTETTIDARPKSADEPHASSTAEQEQNHDGTTDPGATLSVVQGQTSPVPPLDTKFVAESIVNDAMTLASDRVVAVSELEDFIIESVRARVSDDVVTSKNISAISIVVSPRVCPPR